MQVNIDKFLSQIDYSRYVPHVVELNAPEAVPSDVYDACASGRYSFLLESVSKHETIGRYSLIGVKPSFIFSADDDRIGISNDRGSFSYNGDPLAELEKILQVRKRSSSHSIPFIGGGVGFFSYDCSRFVERLSLRKKAGSGWPDIYMMFVDEFILFDHVLDKVYVVCNYVENSASSRDDAIKSVDMNCRAVISVRNNCNDNNLSAYNYSCDIADMSRFSTLGKKNYEELVRSAKEYIRSGDVYQANISHRIDLNSEVNGFNLYKVLSSLNPSPFASYFKMGCREIISCSPERLIKKAGGFIQSRPIAGTRPRGDSETYDFVLRSDLLLNEKERAEHVMLVDLQRNDLGRVSMKGSVEVDEFMAVEKYSHVQHIVSNVSGMLEKDVKFTDILRSVFPGGTITGVPKIRCMEIIDELEPVSRGLYTGSIGYISDNGDADLNIVIRTILKNKNELSIQAGAGIVADSDPEKEYYETLYKAQAMYGAVRSAEEAMPELQIS